MKWSRTTAFAADREGEHTEQWTCTHDDGSCAAFDVAVRAGKPLDVLALKRFDLFQVRDYARFLEEAAAKLYESASRLRAITHCACCGVPAADDNQCILVVFGVPYVRCLRCGHLFVGKQPHSAALERLFSESADHSAIYVDRAAIATRMKQVVEPKLRWCLDRFAASHSGKQPAQVIDVGAGGGHFLAAVNALGMAGEGFELSASSRAFAREAFGLDLCEQNFLTSSRHGVDLVTFWGLLEYVPDPAPLVAKAREVLAADGMLVVEVPRADSVSTAVQGLSPAVVARHMDPTTHIQAFSDESLMTLLLRSGFRPVAAWYFGMDVYELLVQIACRCDDPAIVEVMAEAIPRIQQALDLGRQCDDIIVAAVPLST
jgi:SAM-dependent methyltransferase